MFGQQYTSPLASAAKWIFFGFFIVVLMGFLLGTNFKDATWLNRDIAAAEAERIHIENAYQQETYNLQIRLAAAKTEAEIREIQRQQALLDAKYAHDIQALSQDLVHRDLAFRTWMTALTILAGAFALSLLLSTTIWVGSRARVYVQSNLPKEVPMAKYVPPVKQWIPNLPERQPYDALDPKQVLFENRLNERLQEIAAEHEKQKEAELLAARMKYITDPAKMSGDKRNKLPLAGD
ncbi:MAG: hypothetical protein HUU11_06835 [Anaerolineales bacterium]|nr:hypothetical protein [Anaerolineales bacterium]NUQ84411.1 hypothetical protein [Anaerolineales bacterium]